MKQSVGGMPGLKAGHFFGMWVVGGEESAKLLTPAVERAAVTSTSVEPESFRLKVLGGAFFPNADSVRLTIGCNRRPDELPLARFVPIGD
jgi:hypothetical protein